ncbi:MAG: hypothetical protein AAF567_19475 [Actinomycetota bacterium]
MSTVASIFAIAESSRAQSALLVDTESDLSPLLGLDPPEGPGLREWASTPELGDEAMRRIATEVNFDLSLIHGGFSPWPDAARAGDLASRLERQREMVFVDAGRADEAFTKTLVAASNVRVLVVRNDYLTLHRVQHLDTPPTAVVMLNERGRALGAADAEAVTGASVVLEVAVDASIARCLDAGLAGTRLPRGLLRRAARVIDRLVPAHA